jgi:hypothetical protein
MYANMAECGQCLYTHYYSVKIQGEITFDHEADFRIEWKDLATVQRSTARYGKWDGGEKQKFDDVGWWEKAM